MENLTIFDLMYEDYKITKPIRLIEFFSGIGAQAKALKNLGANFTHWHTCEWAYPSILAYNEIHHNELDGYGKDFSSEMSKDEIIDFLYAKGISANYNEPMKLEQIKRLSEDKLRKIYNAIQSTKDLVNIQQVKGKDLEIVDTNKYEYILTYSFPCQDLSLAGKGAGMSRDSGTRSGMLWEVERILDECNDLESLPQVLLMENVPQVIGQNNIKDFQNWRDKLESLGYSNYIQILNAKDYGIPQNRERAFMISILGEYNYRFPSKIKLEKKLKDMLEDDVDEKYFLSDKQLGQIIHWNAQQEPLETLGKDCSPTLTTRSGAYAAGMVLTSNLDDKNEEKKVGEELLKIKEATKKGYKEAYDGDGVYIGGRMEFHRGTVQKGMAQTLKTSADVGVIVPLKRELCNKLIQDRLVGEGDVIRHSYSNNRLNNGEKNLRRIESKEKLCPTLDTRCDCLGVCVETYEYAKSDNFMQGKDRLHLGNDISGTLLASGNHNGVVINEPKVLGGIGEKKSNGGTQWYQQDRIYDDNIAISVTTSFNLYYKSDLRIRKLTGKECYRLMGFSDEDCDNARKVLSEAMIYHTAGDSICVNVLMAIFKQMIKE